MKVSERARRSTQPAGAPAKGEEMQLSKEFMTVSCNNIVLATWISGGGHWIDGVCDGVVSAACSRRY